MKPSSSPLPTSPRHPLIAAAALLGWFALALQLWLSIRLTVADGRSVTTALWIYLGFFTILTNMLVSMALSAEALGMDGPLGRFFRRPGVTTAIAANIALVALTYNLLLRQLWRPQGWNLVADALLHDVMPAVFLLFWWLAVPKQNLRTRQLGGWLLYPLGYLVYALVRGAIDHWYPYPFIDVGMLGYRRVLINAAGVALIFAIVASLLLALAKLQRRSKRSATGS
jgi:hypothetical protein